MAIVNDPAPPGTSEDFTARHVRRACCGDAASRAWVVQHFTPRLLSQADGRLRGAARRQLEPDDLVDEVWSIALARLPQIVARDGCYTPVLVKFLNTTLRRRLSTILRSDRRKLRWRQQLESAAGSAVLEDLEDVADDGESVVARASNDELGERLRDGIGSLGALDREVLELRGIQELPCRRVAALLGCSPGAVVARFRRALDHLRAALGGLAPFDTESDFRDSR